MSNQCLAELLVLHADHRRVLDVRMLMQTVFDLGREDVLPARHDHVVVTAFDVQASVVVEATHVTGRREVAQSRLVPTARVALKRHPPPGEDAPGGPRSAVVAVVTDGAPVDATDEAPRRAGSAAQVG